MLEEILIKIKKRYPELECWITGLKEESFEDSTLTISVPSQYHIEKFENGYKNLIADTASKMLGRKINVQLQLLLPNIEVAQLQRTEIETKTESKKFDSNPNFKNKTEVEEYVGYAKTKSKKRKNKTSTIISIAENNPMPNPYSVENVACFTGLIGQFFTVPNDRRKSAKVKIEVKCQNGDIKEYELYRGQLKFRDGEGRGQLNTSHAKVLLAVVHMWQKQGCRFKDEDEGFITGVRLSIRELAKTLGFKKFGGATLNWIVKQLDDLRTRYNLLSDGKRGIGFTLIDGIWYSDIKKQSDKLMADIVFNPYIAKQLYERKAFYRNPECYKLKNPTAIKFLLHYDRAIYKGNVITKTIAEVVEDLQIENESRIGIVKSLKRAVKELNGYELNAEYNIKMAMVKVRNRYIIKSERVHKNEVMLPLYHS